MKLTVEIDANEKMTNIGFAKALIDTGCFSAFDLCEISCYLNTYCTARSAEPKCGLANVAKEGAE